MAELRGDRVVLRPLTLDDVPRIAGGDWHDSLLMDLLADEL